jgi:4-hydroxy-3-methylbut-2-enyl diphosphate reductase
VASAVEIVERALKKYGAPLYVYHAIVHNTAVVKDFENRGVIFIDDLNEVPDGERIIFSAHGVPPEVISKAQAKRLQYIDATCPLVTKVHREAVKFSDKAVATILIGHRGHQEMTGTAGYVKQELLHIVETEADVDELTIDPEAPVAYLTQTTLSVDETEGIIARLHKKFKNLLGPARPDICYATQNRQDAVKELARFCDVIVICGSPNSSNSNRLRETGEQAGCESHIVDTAGELDLDILNGKEKVGISSGASVPRYLVDELVANIRGRFPHGGTHEFENTEKDIVFALPQI